MYALLTKNENALPTVMNMNSHFYCDMLQMGYEPMRTGTKKEIEELFEEMVLEFAAEID